MSFWRNVERSGKFILLAVLLAILFVGSCSSHVPNAFGHVAGETYQAWAPAPPTINGEILASEWQTAATTTFTITIGGNPYAGTLFVMNDATNLYLGVKMTDATFSTDPTPDAVAFYFDSNNDGTYGPGEDSIVYINGAAGFIDRFIQAPFTMKYDTDFGGTNDGSGACGAHGGQNHFELSHPLNSADDAHDFSLSPLDTVGFTMAYADAALGQGNWPALATIDSTAWADIVIVAAPPTMSAWASAAPTIDGAVGAAEWAGASHTSFSIGWTFVGDLWVMNDASNLYLAVKIADTSLTAMDRLYFGFDNNNNGVREAGDDLLGLTGDGQFMDLFWGPPTKFDTDAGGTSDGQGNASGSGGHNYFEMSHLLNSADDAHDFSLSAGNTVGFNIEYWDEASGYWGDWPSLNVRNSAHITVASAPVPTPDFTVTWDVPLLSVSQGASGSALCTVTSLSAFSAAVDLSGSWVGVAPSGVTHSFATPITPPAGLTATSTLQISAEAGASTGTFTFRITGTSGALSHNADLQIQVTAGAADFMIIANPSSMSLGPGTSGSSTIEVHSAGIFSAPVTLTSSGAPAGLTLVFGTNPVTPPAGGMASSILTVTVSGAAAGSYPITITGTSGALSHPATLTVQVTTGGGGCLIATAAFGSELSNEVQFLRGFRDKSILNTQSGSSFMIAFNAWYYSFSPAVAQFIREQPTVRIVVKFMLYPLMGILKLGAATFNVFPSNPEASAVISGLVVSSLIGTVYVTPPIAAILYHSSRARRISRKLQLPALAILLCALAAVALTGIFAAPMVLMMIATSTVVLASLITSALFTSRTVVDVLKQA
jgi:hypothetical protein